MLLRLRPDGISLRPTTTLRTMDRILAHAAEHPTVYLPTHDPESVTRLERNILLAPTALRVAQSVRAPRVPVARAS
jgi:glyoxylase-like metal-dependent hydrolase (beta-lactamase superfamily II)